MSLGKENLVETDVLVVGGGEAGCFAAIKAKEQGVNVILVDKGYVGKSGQTPSIDCSVVFEPKRGNLNEWVNHVNQIGEYMNDRDWTEITFMDSLGRWQDLCSWGLELLKWNKAGKVFVSPASKDDGEIVKAYWHGPTGANMYVPKYPIRHSSEVMRKQAVKTGVKIMDRIMIIDLLKQDGRVVGALGIAADNDDLYVFKSKATVLCTGPCGLKAVGIRTFSTGDADAMAYRVGCEITGREWTEHHPVRADFPAWPYSALDRDRLKHYRGNRDKQPAMKMYNAEDQVLPSHWSSSNSELQEAFEAHAGRAPMWWWIPEGGEHIMNRSPKGLPRKEIDEKGSLLGRVRVTQGRSIGQSSHVSDGIWPINKKCESQVPGLFAAGDSLGARAGGPYYPGQGFSSTYCAVTGARAGEGAAEYAKHTKTTEIDNSELARVKEIVCEPIERKGGFTPGWVTQVLQNALFPYWVLYIKKADRLQTALMQVEFLRDNIVPKLAAKDTHELRLAHEVRNMVLTAEMKLRASLMRTESRATHYREDYPMRDDPTWLVWIKVKDDKGGMVLSKEPIPKKWWPDLSVPYEKRYPIVFPGDGREELYGSKPEL